jgi:hypothetical protein
MNDRQDTNPVERSAPKTKKLGRLDTFLLRLGVIGELLRLFITGKRWWMAPLVLFLGIFGLVLALLNSLEVVAPFIYMAF